MQVNYPVPAKPHTSPRSGCPIGIALDVVGDAWTLLVVRDLMFKDHSTYRQFLDAGEGIASNILADRLARLERHGLVTKSKDESDKRRITYRLTEKGIDMAPVLVELVLWAAKHELTEAPPDQVRFMTTNKAAFLAGVRAKWESLVTPPRPNTSSTAPRNRKRVRTASTDS